MSRYLAIALMGVTFAGLPMITGCDKDKETSKSDVQTKHADGSSTEDKTTSKTDLKTGATKTTEEHKTTGATTTP